MSSSNNPLLLCKNKFNRKSSSRQDFSLKNFTLDDAIRRDPAAFYKALTPGGKRVFDYLMMASTRCRHLYFTQEHIAKKAKLSVRHVQRMLAKLVERGVLIMRYRHMTSSEYRYNPFFHESTVQSIIRNISRGAQFIALVLLMPFVRREANELTNQVQHHVEYECRTMTPNDLISINRNRNRYIPLVKHTRARRVPRAETEAERMESAMIAQRNMEQMTQHFPAVVVRLGLLCNLTPAGKLDLMRYPEEALNHVESLWTKHASKVGDKLRWLHGICVRYCKEKRLVINHSYPRHMARIMGITESDDKIICVPKSNQDERSSSRQYSETGGRSSFDLNGSLGKTIDVQSETEFKKRERYDGSSSTQKPSFNIPWETVEQSATVSRKASVEPDQSQGAYYNPATGLYSHRDPESLSSTRVRRSTGPIASKEEANRHIQTILDNLSNLGFHDHEVRTSGARAAEPKRERGIGGALKDLMGSLSSKRANGGSY